jgi:tRNA(Ile)-lysidine synthase
VVGVSGGPDSMALLYLLYCLSEEYSLHIHAAHINHMLRGQESEDDTAYVKNFCGKLNIPVSIKYIDIGKISAESGLSLEEAGREARYGFFSEIACEINASKVALAHNMNDQAETILMRIMRGSGLEGLCGIKPVRDGFYIRPLINTPRTDIEEYCRMHNILPRIDSTNLKPIYARNKVRLELIPYIKKNYNSNIEYVLSSMTELLKEDNDFLNTYVKDLYEDIKIKAKGKVSLDIEKLKGLHTAVKKRIIRKAVEEIKGNLVGIERLHIELILSIIDRGLTGSAVELPGGIRVYISYGQLRMVHMDAAELYEGFCRKICTPGDTYIPETGGVIQSSIVDASADFHSNNKFVKYFDYDKIKDNLIVRSKKEGDIIIPLGFKGRKKLKELFIDSKIPRDERCRIPIVSSGNDIIWVVGLKISDIYKIDNNTKKILRMEYKLLGGNNDA